MDFDILIPIFGILLVMIPVAGVTLAFTLRFAIKPFVETLTKALRESGFTGPGAPVQEAQLRDVYEQLEMMRAEVERLREAQEFDRRLVESRTAGSDRPSGD